MDPSYLARLVLVFSEKFFFIQKICRELVKLLILLHKLAGIEMSQNSNNISVFLFLLLHSLDPLLATCFMWFGFIHYCFIGVFHLLTRFDFLWTGAVECKIKDFPIQYNWGLLQV